MRKTAAGMIALSLPLLMSTVAVAEPSSAEACPAVTDEAAVEDVPEGTDVVACGLVGVMLNKGDLGVEIPASDAATTIVAEDLAGLATTFTAAVDENGLMALRR